MNEKELTENIDKIKQLLTLPGYDKIDAGIELTVSLEEPKIFENLLDGCSIEFTIEGGYEHCGSGGGHRPMLNNWLSKLQIHNGKILDQSTGYYVFLSLILNIPKDTNVDDSLKLENIMELSLKNCWMQILPPNMYRLSELKILDISFNGKLKKTKSDLTTLSKLEYIIDHETFLDHGFTPKFTLKTNDTSCECNGCNESFESERDMVSRYDGNFCSSCDPNWNDLRVWCPCCSQWIDPTINDYKIDFETKVAENDTLFDEEYDCKEESRTKVLFVDNTIIFETICSYCEQDSRLSDDEFESVCIKIKNGAIPKETLAPFFSIEETGITDNQYEMISEYEEEFLG